MFIYIKFYNTFFFITEQSDGSQAFEEGQETWAQNSARDHRNVATPPDGQFPMHNNTNVQFELPKAPVIFVLGNLFNHSFTDTLFISHFLNSGGPGSGKVTHCDNLMQEKKGITHINMTDLLQQYAIGNGKNDHLLFHITRINFLNASKFHFNN